MIGALLVIITSSIVMSVRIQERARELGMVFPDEIRVNIEGDSEE